MLWLYRLLYVPGLILVLPGYLRRMWRRGGFRENLGSRFGRVADLPARRAGVPRVWLQAVSVGELLAVRPIVEALHRERGVEVYLTTTTTTGYALARERFAGLVVGLGYFPMDFWPCSARAWKAIQPDLALIAEGERWPEHLHQARRRGVPVVCLNARLSDRSYMRAMLAPTLVRRLWRGLEVVLASSELDGERFRALGFPAEAVRVTGNIKLDVEIPRLADERRDALRTELGLTDGLIVVGASTWPGEEDALIELLRAARQAGLDCRLLLVPRHAERRAAVAELLGPSGFRFHFRTGGAAAETVDIAVGDTTGELRSFLQLADLVLVGRSLPPHTEGQTPVEAAVLGRPILFGPGMTNFREIAESLIAGGAARAVSDRRELCATGLSLLRDEALRRQLAESAAGWAQANRGAVARTMNEILDCCRKLRT